MTLMAVTLGVSLGEMKKNPEDLTDLMLETSRKMPNVLLAYRFEMAAQKSPLRQARFLCDKNGVATDIPNPDYVAVKR